MPDMGISVWFMWFLFALGLFIAELTLSGFVAVFFAIGAAVAGVLALYGVGMPLQLTVMGVVSFLGIIGGRKFLVSRFSVNRDVIKTNVDALIGQEAIVIKKITAVEKGRILLNGESWAAEGVGGLHLDEGETVVIREIRGVTAMVEGKK